MTWNIPNILTILRLAAAPSIALAFLLAPRPLADWLALVFFAGAAATDWVDGYLARRWKQETLFGAMLDPIADKAMVLTALLVLSTLSGMNILIVLPATFILFREVFVSGLREFLGKTAGLLKVTKLAKWKTATQMVAIVVLLGAGLFAQYFALAGAGMDAAGIDTILNGASADPNGLAWKYHAMMWCFRAGVGLLWVAAILTVLTGADYLRKAMPYLQGGVR